MSIPAIPLATLLDGRRLWRGRRDAQPPSHIPTGWSTLDAALPANGWPEAALTEILHACDGLGEIHLLWPALAQLSQAGKRVVLVAPPYPPHAPAWEAAGLVLSRITIIEAPHEHAAWAMEQCLRSGDCAAVLGWLGQADDRTLRRLQLATATGHALGFVFRPSHALAQASPATLRLEVQPGWLRIHKCRGRAPLAPLAYSYASS
ncbi:MAG TPA: translesion DNA synthesis-associated protein ImuA [Nevskiaceae bacterium]|nr:translesion DNA synthesis-associated protein ImuA [Nevskiaceae bacterium]